MVRFDIGGPIVRLMASYRIGGSFCARAAAARSSVRQILAWIPQISLAGPALLILYMLKYLKSLVVLWQLMLTIRRFTALTATNHLCIGAYKQR